MRMRTGCKRPGRDVGLRRSTLSGWWEGEADRAQPALSALSLDTACCAGVGSARSTSATALLPDAKLLDEAAVPLDVLALQVVQEPPPLADQHHEPPPGMMVLRVGLEVFGQVADPLAQDGHLDLGRPRVGAV